MTEAATADVPATTPTPPTPEDDFLRIKMRVQQGLMSLDAALNYVFTRLGGETPDMGDVEFERIRTRVQNGLLAFEQAMDYVFARVTGAIPENTSGATPSTDPDVPQKPGIEFTVSSDVDTDKKTKDLADAGAANLNTGITNEEQGNDLATAIAFDPDFADNLRTAGGGIDSSTDLTGTITAFTAKNPTQITVDTEDALLLTVNETITLEALTGDATAMAYINGQIVNVLSTGKKVTIDIDMTGQIVDGLTADYVRNEEVVV